MFGFPKNPSDGMIFEASPGLFFQFSASEDCWIRVDGLKALGLATPTTAGLMSPDDLKKLNGLIIPPPQSTLKGEECKTVFSQGKVRLTSTDASLEISPSLTLQNKGAGFAQPWFLHENTAGYDFNLNFDDILTALKQNGKFTQVQIQGRQGQKGDPGQPGIDRLDTGPKGATGPAGANSPFKGLIATEPNALSLVDDNANRAIVDIQAVSGPNGNFLIATRANIGNPNACPSEVTPKAIISPQVLVLNKLENSLVRTLAETNDCHNPCTICVTSLHYVNMETLLDSMFERFLEQLSALKTAKEELATTWLQTMITVFSEQKAALCCALENCTTAQSNASQRQYIEQQRIQAAQADQQLIIDGQDDRININMNADAACPSPTPVDANVKRGVGCECVLQFTLDSVAHSTDPRGLFLDKPPAQVDLKVNNAFQTVKSGLLQTHSEIASSSAVGTAPVSATRVIKISQIVIDVSAVGIAGTGDQSFDQLIDPTKWFIQIENFETIVNPTHAGTITISAVLVQNGVTIGTFQAHMPLGQIASGTIKLLAQSVDKQKLLDYATKTTDPADLTITIDTSVPFTTNDNTSSVAADYTLGELRLTNVSPSASVDDILLLDWEGNNWVVDDVATAQGSNQGFIQLSLPAGTYVAEILDCCADMNTSRHIWKGTAAIEYNTTQEVTAAHGTETPSPTFTARATAMFPDLGAFNNNADARTKYLGSTISFTHLGGQIRAWVVDPDNIPSNNAGSITVCIKSIQCVQDQSGSTPIDPGAIFVYSNVINPLNLIGIIYPYTGNLDAIANYGYGEGTAEAANLHFGPFGSIFPGGSANTGVDRSFLTTQSFFYEGPDGLSFFTLNGGTGSAAINNIKMSFGVLGNSNPTKILVADDPEEVAKVADESYNTNWGIGSFGTDGIVLGYLDMPVGGGWAIAVTPTDLGLNQLWQAHSVDGNKFSLAFIPTGIKDIYAKQQVIFTPIKAGCVMSFKEIQWLERGHRTGAACSAVVNIDGTSYIVVKRSLGSDTTCGGGESLSNPCIAQYITLGLGHPAIAWPTANGEEFLGIPTSGGHGFMLDQVFSDKVMAKLAAGDFTNAVGDPKANIPFVLVATS
jgi:hypothetical protein